MSRSFQKTPVTSWAIVRPGEEAKYKRSARRAERLAAKRALIEGEELLPHKKEYGNPVMGPKDGKQRFDPNKYPKDMRK